MQITDPFSQVWTDDVDPPVLTPRMRECLAWAQQGKNANEIGLIIGISGRTVEKHIAHAFEALGVRSRVQAILRARELGLLGGQAPAEPMHRSFKPQNHAPPKRRVRS